MKTFRFIFFLSLTVALTVSFNTRIANVPPLGKFFSPFHGFWQNAESEGVNYKEKLKLSGLESEVEVYYDELRIPHIYAQNDRDLHMVQGYLTARDRLWQMDFFSRLVYGRLSEVIGERALDFDRYNRRIGLKKMTRDLYANLSQEPEILEMVNAYSAGVNAYIEQLSYDEYPIEFKLLDYSPESWTPEKSCLAYAMLSNTLSKGESDLENTNALMILGRQMFDLLYPEQLGNLDPVISKERKWEFEPLKVIKPDITFPKIPVNKTTDKPHPLNGSNNFAVGPEKSKSGNVLLANEPDLELTLPSIWYAYHLHTNEKNVMGVTVPGTPIILIGFNERISWGVTNSPRDQVDWYSITFRDSSRTEYLYNNQWFKTQKVVEEIEVSGGDTFYDTIVYTHHGPVVYDRNFLEENGHVNFAMKWIAHFPSTTFSAMNQINKATNYEEFVEALTKFQGPPQNFIFGSVDGDIAMWLPGKFPLKWREQGKFLMDGSDPKHEWKAYIPFEHYMYQKNPSRGFVSSANQHQVDSLYPYYVYDHNYEYNRGRRINDRLKILSEVLPKDMMKLQNDNFNYQASESLSFMLDQLDTTEFSSREWDFYKTLSQWDYFNEPSLKAPTMYQLWYDILYAQLWDEFDTISLAIDKPNNYVTIHRLKADSTFRFSDVLETDKKESTKDLLNTSFYNALDSLQNWQEENEEDFSWFMFKNTSIKHLLRLAPFSETNIRIGGYKNIVNAATKGHGPSWRMVVELDPNGIKAWGVYPGSQTGNPGSPLYGHMIEKWASGEYSQLLFADDISGSNQVIFKQNIIPR